MPPQAPPKIYGVQVSHLQAYGTDYRPWRYHKPPFTPSSGKVADGCLRYEKSLFLALVGFYAFSCLYWFLGLVISGYGFGRRLTTRGSMRPGRSAQGRTPGSSGSHG
jgi:hypothetical protein